MNLLSKNNSEDLIDFFRYNFKNFYKTDFISNFIYITSGNLKFVLDNNGSFYVGTKDDSFENSEFIFLFQINDADIVKVFFKIAWENNIQNKEH